jgi:basic membrane protein A
MAISKILDGSIEPRNYLLGLNENGIGLAGYGKFDSAISAENKAKVAQLLADIKAGKVTDLPAIR